MINWKPLYTKFLYSFEKKNCREELYVAMTTSDTTAHPSFFDIRRCWKGSRRIQAEFDNDVDDALLSMHHYSSAATFLARSKTFVANVWSWTPRSLTTVDTSLIFRVLQMLFLTHTIPQTYSILHSLMARKILNLFASTLLAQNHHEDQVVQRRIVTLFSAQEQNSVYERRLCDDFSKCFKFFKKPLIFHSEWHFSLHRLNPFHVLNKAKKSGNFFRTENLCGWNIFSRTFQSDPRELSSHCSLVEKYHISQPENTKRQLTQTATAQFIKRKRIHVGPKPDDDDDDVLDVGSRPHRRHRSRRFPVCAKSAEGVDGKIWFTIMIVISFSLRRETMCFMRMWSRQTAHVRPRPSLPAFSPV